MHLFKLFVLILSAIATLSDGRSPSVIRLTPDEKWLNLSRIDALPDADHEYAGVSLTPGRFMGARATINVWNPSVVQPEVSFSQIWLEAGPRESMNTVEAGWMVDTVSYPRNQAKIFIFYTADGYRTRCYNLECKDGFRLIRGSRFAPNNLLEPVSVYDNEQQRDLTIAIWKDQVSGDWWLRIEEEIVGYWPEKLFTHLKGPAEKIRWGGEIVNTKPRGRHTSTQMGSGHFPSEGYRRASYFRHLKFLDDRFIERDPVNLQTFVTKPNCYDLLLNLDPPGTCGVNFYYGGPGFSAQCPI